MKKHLILSLALLASGVAQAQLHSHSIQDAIAAIEKTVHRGPANSQLVAAMTALQVALDDLQTTHSNLVALKKHLIEVSAAVDAGIKDLDDEINALATVVGVEEAVVTPVVIPTTPAPTVVPTTLPAINSDADEEDEHDNV